MYHRFTTVILNKLLGKDSLSLRLKSIVIQTPIHAQLAADRVLVQTCTFVFGFSAT